MDLPENIQLFHVNLEVEGEIVSAQLTAEEIEIISNGNYFNFNTDFQYQLISDFTDTNEYLKKFDEAKKIVSSNETEQPEGSGETKKKWGSNATRLLISLRLQKEEAFCNPKCKKTKLWDDISMIMRKNNYQYSGNECHAKYRNLIQTYKNNKDKRLKSTGESKITWEYYEQFDDVLGYKLSTVPTENLLSANMEIDADVISKKIDDDVISKKENKCPHKSKEKKLSVSQYLYEKNKSKATRDQKDDIRWEEKKALKEKEIEAINNLADAIRGDIRSRRINSDSD